MDIPVSERESPTVLTYHKIGSHLEIGITTVKRRRFAEHLDLILKLELVFTTAGTAASGPKPGRVAVTFDDGYESAFTEAFPEMASRAVQGTVFPVVGSIGGLNVWDVNLAPRPVMHMSWSHLREMSEAGFEIGSHTITHRDLTRVNVRDLDRELIDSKMMIEDKIGVRVRSICYPFGRYSHRVIDRAVAAGYTCGFTSSPGASDSLMAIGRWGVYSIDGAGSLERKLGVRAGRGLERFKNTVIAKLALGTTLIKH